MDNASSQAQPDCPMDVDQGEDQHSSVQWSATESLRASSVPLRPSEFTVGYVYSSEMMQHYSPQGHPEQPERISRIMQAIKDAHCHMKMKRLHIRPVKREEALLVHSEDHWDKVQAIQCEFPDFKLFRRPATEISRVY
jgi:histone deacetylase 6